MVACCLAGSAAVSGLPASRGAVPGTTTGRERLRAVHARRRRRGSLNPVAAHPATLAAHMCAAPYISGNGYQQAARLTGVHVDGIGGGKMRHRAPVGADAFPHQTCSGIRNTLWADRRVANGGPAPMRPVPVGGNPAPGRRPFGYSHDGAIAHRTVKCSHICNDTPDVTDIRTRLAGHVAAAPTGLTARVHGLWSCEPCVVVVVGVSGGVQACCAVADLAQSITAEDVEDRVGLLLRLPPSLTADHGAEYRGRLAPRHRVTPSGVSKPSTLHSSR